MCCRLGSARSYPLLIRRTGRGSRLQCSWLLPISLVHQPSAPHCLPPIVLAGRYGVYGQGHGHRYGVYGQEHKHRGYGAYGHHRRLASIEAGATRELQGLTHGHKHHGKRSWWAAGTHKELGWLLSCARSASTRLQGWLCNV